MAADGNKSMGTCCLMPSDAKCVFQENQEPSTSCKELVDELKQNGDAYVKLELLTVVSLIVSAGTLIQGS